MKTVDSKTDKDLVALMEKAANFHGHLGPYLVIGVRIGQIAKRILNTNPRKISTLQATAKVPLLTPFSCVLDGIQVTTHCTIGNQKLRIEKSQEGITVYFELQNSDKALKVSVNPKIIGMLTNKISEGVSNKELAWEIVHMPESQLFMIENR